ncbi:MAG: FHA domain-containing protein [Planctomycetota bacterium]
MSIKFTCSGCQKAYKVPEKYAGKKFKCKSCDTTVRVPADSQSGISSKRAAAVSKRSVAASSSGRSGRMDEAGEPSSSSSSSRRSSSSSSSSSSSKSGRSSKRVEAAPSGSLRAKKAKPGSETERFKPIDLTEGNAIKQFAAKKPEEFKRGEGRLTYFEDGKPVKAYRLSKGEAVIGRGEDCGICIPLASVSREHSKIEYKLGTFIATDLQSKNGLLVNGRAVRRVALRNGDVIQVGQGILRLDC